jgi:hypothetical protein
LTKPTVQELLSRLREIIDLGWTTGCPARDLFDHPVLNPNDPAAVKWCLTGAIVKATYDLSNQGTIPVQNGDLLVLAITKVVGLDLVAYNDHLGQTQSQISLDLKQVPTTLGKLIILRNSTLHF